MSEQCSSNCALPGAGRPETAGALTPVVDTVLELKEAAAAQQKMLDRGSFGKLVLRI